MKNILIVFFMGLGLASGAVNLKRSIDRIQAQIQNATDHPANWTQLPAIIKMVLPCLSGLGMFKVESGGGLPTGLTQYIENFTPQKFAQELLLVDWAEVTANPQQEDPSDFLKELKAFMSTPTFTKLHNQLWDNDEFLDLVGYLYTAKYYDIYSNIKSFYETMGRKDLGDKLPTSPPKYSDKSRTARQATSFAGHKTTSNFPVISVKSDFFKKADETCDLQTLFKALEMLNASYISEVLKILLYMLQEFIGNAGMHILFLKIGEPQKGVMFHEFLSQTDVQDSFHIIRGIVLHSRPIAQLNDILRRLTGLDIGNDKLFMYLVNLIKYLIWNQPFPAQEM